MHDGKQQYKPEISHTAKLLVLASPQADHYFFINDGEPTTTRLESARYSYKRYTDALTGEVLDAKAIALEGYSGRWIRAEK